MSGGTTPLDPGRRFAPNAGELPGRRGHAWGAPRRPGGLATRRI
jgi:hypothetical protein